MVASTSRLSYSAEYDLLDQAIADGKGIKIKFTDLGEAMHFRSRVHTARTIDRRDNAETYGEEHPLYGRSVYDEVICKIRQEGEGYVLIMEISTARKFDVESLKEGDTA